MRRNVPARNGMPSTVTEPEVADQPDQGGLARPGRPDDGDEGASLDVQVERLQGQQAIRVTLAQAAQFDRCHGHRVPVTSASDPW
jgi:hypothetical protein